MCGMAKDDVIELGASNMEAELRKRSRTSKSGVTRDRFTVEIHGDSLLINTDPKSLGRPVAEAIAQLLKDRISSIAAVVSPGVKKAREAARKAFDAGKPWAMRQYSGGRIGSRAPNQTDRKFNDSGRLVESIAVGANDDTFTVNMAANRWRPELVRGGVAGIQRIWEDLKRHVPELGDARKLMDSIPVRRAVQQSMKDAIVKAGEKRVEATRQLMQARIQVAKAFLSLVA